MYNGTILLYTYLGNTIILNYAEAIIDFVVIYLIMPVFKVGDPKQLPATVMSGLASKFLYECSMFERLQRAGYPVIMLTKQVVYYCILFLTSYNTV